MAFTRPTVNTEISAADFGQPVYDLLTPTAWTNVTFQNSWANMGGYQAVQYRKVGDMVQMRGMMGSGTMGQTAFTLPVGFRPPALVMGSTGSYNTGSFTWVVARFDCNPDGRIVPIDGINQYYVMLTSFSVTA